MRVGRYPGSRGMCIAPRYYGGRRKPSLVIVNKGSRRVGGRRNGGSVRQRLHPAILGHSDDGNPCNKAAVRGVR